MGLQFLKVIYIKQTNGNLFFLWDETACVRIALLNKKNSMIRYFLPTHGTLKDLTYDHLTNQYKFVCKSHFASILNLVSSVDQYIYR